MNEQPVTTVNEHNIWVRALFIVLMALVFQLSGTLLFIVAVIQFALALLTDAPNARLLSFGRGLGFYIRQIVNFLTFVSEDIPFPFSDWPAGD